MPVDLRVVFTADARRDLSGLLLYSEQQWGGQQRRNYQADIRRAIAAIAHNPHSGVKGESLPVGFRAHRIGKHIIYYRVQPTEVLLMRILHERMEHQRHLIEP